MQLHNGTLKFLKELKKNNNKPWFDTHRKEYETVRESFINFTGAVLEGLVKINPDLKGLQPKDCVFRINRDVRFSKDKSPYKHHFAAIFAEGGKKSPHPGYYLHVEPGGENYVGGGLWAPEKEQLANVRQEIDYNLKAFKSVVEKKSFKSTFGELYDYKISTVPKGYDVNNPAIKYLKYKSFVYGRSFTDTESMSKDFSGMVVKTYKELNPFILFLRHANG